MAAAVIKKKMAVHNNMDKDFMLKDN